MCLRDCWLFNFCTNDICERTTILIFNRRLNFISSDGKFFVEPSINRSINSLFLDSPSIRWLFAFSFSERSDRLDHSLGRPIFEIKTREDKWNVREKRSRASYLPIGGFVWFVGVRFTRAIYFSRSASDTHTGAGKPDRNATRYFKRRTRVGFPDLVAARVLRK